MTTIEDVTNVVEEVITSIEGAEIKPISKKTRKEAVKFKNNPSLEGFLELSEAEIKEYCSDITATMILKWKAEAETLIANLAVMGSSLRFSLLDVVDNRTLEVRDLEHLYAQADLEVKAKSDFICQMSDKGKELSQAKLDELFKVDHDALIGVADDEIANCISYMDDYTKHYVDKMNRLKELREHISQLEADKLIPVSVPSGFVDNQFFKLIKIADGIAYFVTTPIVITDTRSCGFKPINLGSYMVLFKTSGKFTSSSIRVFPFNDNIRTKRGYYHPHVSSSGSICWGNGLEPAMKAVTEKDMNKVFKILASLLSVYNADSPYDGINEFKIASKERMTTLAYTKGWMNMTCYTGLSQSLGYPVISDLTNPYACSTLGSIFERLSGTYLSNSDYAVMIKSSGFEKWLDTEVFEVDTELKPIFFCVPKIEGMDLVISSDVKIPLFKATDKLTIKLTRNGRYALIHSYEEDGKGETKTICNISKALLDVKETLALPENKEKIVTTRELLAKITKLAKIANEESKNATAN